MEPFPPDRTRQIERAKAEVRRICRSVGADAFVFVMSVPSAADPRVRRFASSVEGGRHLLTRMIDHVGCAVADDPLPPEVQQWNG